MKIIYIYNQAFFYKNYSNVNIFNKKFIFKYLFIRNCFFELVFFVIEVFFPVLCNIQKL